MDTGYRKPVCPVGKSPGAVLGDTQLGPRECKFDSSCKTGLPEPAAASLTRECCRDLIRSRRDFGLWNALNRRSVSRLRLVGASWLALFAIGAWF